MATEGEAGERHSRWGSQKTRGCQMRFQGFQMSFYAFSPVKNFITENEGNRKKMPIIPQPKHIPGNTSGLTPDLPVCVLTDTVVITCASLCVLPSPLKSSQQHLRVLTAS